MACDRCHSKKLKCVGGIPCSSCRTRGESCLFKRRGHRNARACSNQTLTQVEGGSPSFLHRATSKTLADVDDTERTSNAAHNYSRASNAEAAAGEYSQGQPELGLSWDELLDSTVVSTGSLPYSDNLTLFDFLAFEAEASSALAQELIGSSDGYTGNAEWPIMPPYQPAAQDNTARPCEQALNVLLGYMNEVSSEGPSSRPQDMAWIYKSPCTELYDIEMIEILLSLFQLHVTTTFPVFKHINQPGKLHEGLRLAMAAVGGIYCSTSGASVVAKALFSDARRLLLTFVYCDEEVHDVDDQIGIMKYFIYLELFGILSGDKRCYEITEVFHPTMLEVAYTFGILPSKGMRNTDDDAKNRALESIYILECYRVLLLQRPPHFYPTLEASEGQPVEGCYLPGILSSLLTPGSTIDLTCFLYNQNVLVAALAILSWPIMPRGFDSGKEQCLWSRESIELALSRWRRLLPVDSQDNLLPLYSLTNITLNANLRLIQRFAFSSTDSRSHRHIPDHILVYLRRWTRTEECQISLYHAGTLVEHATTVLYGSGTSKVHGTEDLSPVAEIPHLSYGIFFSCLVIWCYQALAEKRDDQLLSTLNKGMGLLQSSQVHISQIFYRIMTKVTVSSQ